MNYNFHVLIFFTLLQLVVGPQTFGLFVPVELELLSFRLEPVSKNRCEIKLVVDYAFYKRIGNGNYANCARYLVSLSILVIFNFLHILG
jgi:hypothetical protein